MMTVMWDTLNGKSSGPQEERGKSAAVVKAKGLEVETSLGAESFQKTFVPSKKEQKATGGSWYIEADQICVLNYYTS